MTIKIHITRLIITNMRNKPARMEMLWNDCQWSRAVSEWRPNLWAIIITLRLSNPCLCIRFTDELDNDDPKSWCCAHSALISMPICQPAISANWAYTYYELGCGAISANTQHLATKTCNYSNFRFVVYIREWRAQKAKLQKQLIASESFSCAAELLSWPAADKWAQLSLVGQQANKPAASSPTPPSSVPTVQPRHISGIHSPPPWPRLRTSRSCSRRTATCGRLSMRSVAGELRSLPGCTIHTSIHRCVHS